MLAMSFSVETLTTAPGMGAWKSDHRAAFLSNSGSEQRLMDACSESCSFKLWILVARAILAFPHQALVPHDSELEPD